MTKTCHTWTRITRSLTLLTAATLLSASALGQSPSSLKALAQVESSGRASAVGDRGRALGKYQFWRPMWEDTTQWRAARHLPTAPYSNALHPATADSYAASCLQMLTARFVAQAGRKPTDKELYACFNLGVRGFFRTYGGQLAKCPAITQRAANTFSRLCRTS